MRARSPYARRLLASFASRVSSSSPPIRCARRRCAQCLLRPSRRNLAGPSKGLSLAASAEKPPTRQRNQTGAAQNYSRQPAGPPTQPGRSCDLALNYTGRIRCAGPRGTLRVAMPLMKRGGFTRQLPDRAAHAPGKETSRLTAPGPKLASEDGNVGAEVSECHAPRRGRLGSLGSGDARLELRGQLGSVELPPCDGSTQETAVWTLCCLIADAA